MANQLMVKMVLDTWNSKLKEANDIIDNLTDAQLEKEVAPGRNRGVYLVGHITASHDSIFPLFSISERLYPELERIFIKHADREVENKFSAGEIRSFWKEVNSKLNGRFSKISPEQWFEKHTAVSAEDFVKQPHRNKLNVVLNRANHMAYHSGQLVFLKNKISG